MASIKASVVLRARACSLCEIVSTDYLSNRSRVCLVCRPERDAVCSVCGAAHKTTLPGTYCTACRTAVSRRTKNAAYDPVKRSAAREALKVETFNAYGGCFCACCGEVCISMLTLDHIAGDGAAQRRTDGVINSGATTWRWLRNRGYPDGFQVLCFSCNSSKHYLGKCEHQLRLEAL